MSQQPLIPRDPQRRLPLFVSASHQPTPPPLSPRSLRSICRAFGLSPDAEAIPLAEGILNDNYRLTNAQGSFVVKHYRRPSSQLALEQAALHALAARGLPVPLPILSQRGRSFILREGRPLRLFPFISGQHYHGSCLEPHQSEELGILLARLHRCLETLSHTVQQPFWVPSVSTTHTVQKIECLLIFIQNKPQWDAFDEFASEHLSMLRHRLREGPQPEDSGSLALFLYHYVHGDFQPLNVLFAQGQPCAVLDWDRVNIKPRLWEVVRAIAFWFVDLHSGAIDLLRSQHFLAGYAAHAPVDADQLRMMIRNFWWDKLHDLWIFEAHYQRTDTRADQIILSNARLIDWLAGHQDDLFEALRQVL